MVLTNHKGNMCIPDQIDKLTSRHIAKLLTRLGKTIEPVQESEIKRQFRFLADDIKQVNTNTETSENDTTEQTDSIGNR